ncbi:MAG: hypothetical protein WC072_06970, partial [Methanoregulaceae archaeon]
MAGIIRIYHPIACEKMHPEDDGTHRMRPTASSLDGLLNRTVHVMTFGCTYNSGDSRKLKEILKAQGCRLVDAPGEAEAVVVNTCTVVGSTERRMLRVLS